MTSRNKGIKAKTRANASPDSLKREQNLVRKNTLTVSAEDKSASTAKHFQAEAIANLSGEIIAILATDGFDQAALLESKHALEQEGAKIDVVSPKASSITGWDLDKWGVKIPVDVDLTQANPDHYNGLLLSGGIINTDQLRSDEEAIAFVRSFHAAGKPVGSICHGAWMVIEAGVLDGRDITSWPSMKTDINNAGGHWVDKAVVVDHGLVSSRSTDDVAEFSQAMIQELIGQRQGRINVGPVDV